MKSPLLGSRSTTPVTTPRAILIAAAAAISIFSGPAWSADTSSANNVANAVQARAPLDIEKLLVTEEIRRLRVLYGQYLDTNDMVAIATLFAPDAVVDAGLGVWRGRDEIRKGLAAAFRDYDKRGHGSYPFLHAMANPWIVLTGPDSAKGRTYLIDFATEREPAQNPLLLLATYADEYKKIDGTWYINRSRLDIIWPARNIGGGAPDQAMVLPK